VRNRTRGAADVTIGTDAATWLALREGKLSGWMNSAPAGTVVLIHGLGGNKTSLFETISALSPQYRVHAIDLPGFGSSSKPLRAPYDAPWFARSVLRFLNALEIERSHFVGNSMGGRVAIEVGLTAPKRVLSLSLLAPSMAWRRRRELVPIVKLLRPELAAIPHSFLSRMVARQFWGMFADPSRLHPSVGSVAAEEFLRTYRSREARIAFHAAARHVYLEDPFGSSGFWTSLSELEPPRCSSGEIAMRWSRSPSAATCARPCPVRVRSCWRSAATYRRPSFRS